MLRKLTTMALCGLLAFTACQTEEVQPAASALPETEGRPLVIGEYMSAWEAADALNARVVVEECNSNYRRTVQYYELDWVYEGPQYNYYDIASLEDKARQIAWENARSGPGFIESVRSMSYNVDFLLCGCDAYYIGVTITYQICPLPCLGCDDDPVYEI